MPEVRNTKMQITVRDCLKLPIFDSAVIAAGASGLERCVNIITTAEIISESDEEFKKLARPNELTISAFASIANNPELQVLTVRRSAASNGAGLVLFYVGIYLKELSQELLDVANELNYPIIVIPSDSDIAYVDMISAVMELTMKEKLLDKTVKESTSDYVCAVLNNNQVQSDIIAKRLGIYSNNLHGICVFSDISGSNISNTALALSKQFSRNLKDLGIEVISSIVDKRVVFLLFSENKKDSIFTAFKEEFKNFTDAINSSKVIIFAYFSKAHMIPLSDIYLDFCDATKYLTLIFPYRNGFDSFAVQFALSCANVIKYHDEFFNRSRIYSLLDKLTDEDLLKTLSIYMLDSDMSSSMASKLLYVHTNTIIYRINKIKETLHFTLSDTSEIISLCTALAVRRILEKN
jgi:sugar diacid utilization regulator